MMLKTFTASNGKKLEYSTPVIMISTLDEHGKEELNLELLHTHFDQGVFRHAFGKYKKATRVLLTEFCESLGITEVENGRRDGSQKKLVSKQKGEE